MVSHNLPGRFSSTKVILHSWSFIVVNRIIPELIVITERDNLKQHNTVIRSLQAKMLIKHTNIRVETYCREKVVTHNRTCSRSLICTWIESAVSFRK